MPIMIMLITSGTLCREQKPCSFVLMHTWNTLLPAMITFFCFSRKQNLEE